MRRLPPSSLLLRLLMALGPVAALACGAPAGHPPSLTACVVAAVLSLAYAVRPEAWFGTAVVLGVVLWWAQALDGALPVSVLPAMAALTAAHVAGLLADLGPSRMRLAGDVGRRWAQRGLLGFAVAGALWCLARTVDGTRAPGLWLLAVALGTAASVAAATVLHRSSPS